MRISYTAKPRSENALGDLTSIAFKGITKQPLVQEADNARGIPALFADLGCQGNLASYYVMLELKMN